MVQYCFGMSDVSNARRLDSTRSGARVGRKRDASRDPAILDAALEVLAEVGYDRMTIDAVAVRAGAARATVYRRWPTKAQLMLDAVARMTGADIDPSALPDTGSLREDMVATIADQSAAEQQVRIQVLASLLLLAKTDRSLADAALGEGIGPWITVNRELLQRAIDRGEFPEADVDTLAQVIPMMCVARAVQQQPITREFSLALIDGVILPAMRGGSAEAGRHPFPNKPGHQGTRRGSTQP